MAKRMGTLDAIHVESIAVKLGHTLADVHAVKDVAQNVARVAGMMGYEGTGCSNLGKKHTYWLVIFDIEATQAKAISEGPMGFRMEQIEPTAEQLVCSCEAHEGEGR